jgi:hypothetical protein
VVTLVLDMRALIGESIGPFELVKLGSGELGESNQSGHSDLLTAWELHLSTSQGLEHVRDIFGEGSDRDLWITNLNSAGFAVGFTPSVSHTGLDSISSSAGKHFIDSENVPWMDSDSHMVEIFCTGFIQVFIARNTGSLQSF